MVLYVEACESGSMFDEILPDDMNGMLHILVIHWVDVLWI